MKYLRRIIGIAEFDRIGNEAIRSKLEQEQILHTMKNNQLSWFVEFSKNRKIFAGCKIEEGE